MSMMYLPSLPVEYIPCQDDKKIMWDATIGTTYLTLTLHEQC